jgi:putative ABC transport system permease protein
VICAATPSEVSDSEQTLCEIERSLTRTERHFPSPLVPDDPVIIQRMGTIERVMKDVEYAIRTLAKTPTFTAIAVITLATGIGATVGIFTIVNAVLLRPLPIHDPERVGIVNAQEVKRHDTVGASWTKYEAMRASNHVFTNTAAYVDRDVTFGSGNTPEQILGARVTWTFFDVLGVQPALGRTFRPEEDVENAAPVALVTNGFWQRLLGGTPDAVGRSIKIDGRDTLVVGVLPAEFRFQFSNREPQVYLTAVFTPAIMTAAQVRHGAGFLEYVVRLKPGVSFAQASSDLLSVDAQYGRDFGGFVDANRYTLHLVPFTDNLVGVVRPALLMLLGAVGLVLLIACANVAHLLLARAAVRQREVAVRLALGASRARLIQQFLTESLVLSLGGCALGAMMARSAIGLLVAHGPANIPRLTDVTADARVLAFSIAVSLLTAVIFGIAPALRASRIPVGVLKDSRSGEATSRSSSRFHNLLAASETAITVTLLIAAGLLFQSLVRMQAVNPGFNPDHVYAARVALPRAKYAQPFQREAFFTELLHRLQSEPGLTRIGATSVLPMNQENFGFFFFVEGQPSLGLGRDPVTSARHVSPDYFDVMRIPLRRGRTFTDGDNARSRPVAIVNETTARRYFPNVDPVGRHFAITGDNVPREIVGVVGDVHFDGPARSDQDEVYLPYRQVPWPTMTVVAASPLAADQVAAILRREVTRLDPDQAVAELTTMQQVVAASTTQQEFTSSLLGAFALLATTLAVIGLYGVTTLFVNQRRHEFGIRMALGAQRSAVLLLVIRQGMRAILGGAVVGLLGAFAASRVLSGLLFGITATNPVTYAVGAVALCIVGLIACYVPALRAVAVDPALALRHE